MRIITTFIDIIGSLVAIIVIFGLVVSLTSCTGMEGEGVKPVSPDGRSVVYQDENGKPCPDPYNPCPPPPPDRPTNLKVVDDGQVPAEPYVEPPCVPFINRDEHGFVTSQRTCNNLDRDSTPSQAWDKYGHACLNDTDEVLDSLDRMYGDGSHERASYSGWEHDYLVKVHGDWWKLTCGELKTGNIAGRPTWEETLEQNRIKDEAVTEARRIASRLWPLIKDACLEGEDRAVTAEDIVHIDKYEVLAYYEDTAVHDTIDIYFSRFWERWYAGTGNSPIMTCGDVLAQCGNHYGGGFEGYAICGNEPEDN